MNTSSAWRVPNDARRRSEWRVQRRARKAKKIETAMRSDLGNSDIAVWRLIHGSDSGLNLSLSDLFGKEIEAPSMRRIVMSFFTDRPITLKVKGQSQTTINRLEAIQNFVDKKVKAEIEAAKRKVNM